MAYSVTIGPHTSTGRCVCEPSVETEVRTERCLGCQIRHLKFHALPFSLTRLAHCCPPGTRSPFLHYLSSPSLALSFFFMSVRHYFYIFFSVLIKKFVFKHLHSFSKQEKFEFSKQDKVEIAPSDSLVYVHMLSALF